MVNNHNYFLFSLKNKNLKRKFLESICNTYFAEPVMIQTHIRMDFNMFYIKTYNGCVCSSQLNPTQPTIIYCHSSRHYGNWSAVIKTILTRRSIISFCCSGCVVAVWWWYDDAMPQVNEFFDAVSKWMLHTAHITLQTHTLIPRS